MNRKYCDIISGIIFMFFSSCIYILSITTLKRNENIKYDSSTMPKIIATLLFLISLMLVIKGFKNLIKQQKIENNTPKINVLAVLITFILIGFYTFSMEYLGFILSSIFYITIQTIVFTNYNWKGLWKYASIAIITSLISYLFFTRCLYLLLPAGLINL